ncbi:hypothetical protein NFI96_005168 [Prochilodus magdalenae]|nr:hypothetical protein NFI96_005168 [Prochilodus magdalenae]
MRLIIALEGLIRMWNVRNLSRAVNESDGGKPEFLHMGEMVDGVDMRAEVGLLSRNILIRGEMEAGCYGSESCTFFSFDTFGGHLKLEHPHTVPADGAVGVEVEGHQAFWTYDNKPFILALTTVPPHTDSLGVSTKTKAGLVTEDDPLPPRNVERGFKAVHIQGVEFLHMGQQSMGHYPVHFHMNGDVDQRGGYDPPTYVKDLSIHHTFSRCVTIHGSNGLLVKDVVGYDALGHCFFTEDGPEERNTFEHCLGLMVKAGTLLPSDRDSKMCRYITDGAYPGYVAKPRQDCRSAHAGTMACSTSPSRYRLNSKRAEQNKAIREPPERKQWNIHLKNSYTRKELEYPHTVPADGAVGVEVEGHQVFWMCDYKPFILVLTTVPPHTDSLGVSTNTKAGLVTEDDPLPF